MKLGFYARKNFFTKTNEDKGYLIFEGDRNAEQAEYLEGFADFQYDEVKTDLKFGAEISFDFGRESNKDRKMRYKLYDRDAELKKHNKDLKPLDDWDCLAIERDYKFYIDHTGGLPDVRHKFNRTQYLDIMETYLVFCQPENLNAKKALYRTLDSNKIVLKRYQESQEDKRFRQVMASNDVSMLRMYLQYYPDSPRKAQVQSKIDVLSDYQDWNKARQGNSFKSYLWYMNEHPSGKFIGDAEKGIYNLVKERHTVKDYEIYIKKFPKGKYVNEARKAIHQLKKQRNNMMY